MKIILIGNKQRGISCLEKLNDSNHEIISVIGNKLTKYENYFVRKAKQIGFIALQPENINDSKFVHKLFSLEPDLIVIAGYSQILKKGLLSLPRYGCINLHGGKLPKYRGSSPMNWALINNEKQFTITIIKVDAGVDTGDILAEKTFDIQPEYNITDLHKLADKYFPEMLLEVINKIEKGTLNSEVQGIEKASYYPLRFPNDGIVFFDQIRAEEIHNRVRALTSPFPGVISFYKNKKIKILKSSLSHTPYYGESGRIYRISLKRGLLVCAKDKCIWLEKIVDFDTNKNCIDYFSRYESLATIREFAQKFYENSK